MKRKKKLVCVIGLGQFGMELARSLARDCEVLAVDSDEARIEEIRDFVQRAVVMNARDMKTIVEVVSPDFDEAIVCMGKNLEASILCTLHLRKLGIPAVRVKAEDEDHAEILRSIGATQVIFPERETARRIALQIVNPNLLDFIPISQDYNVTEVIAPESFHRHSLADLKFRSRFNVFVIAVKRSGEDGIEFLPGPDYVVRPGDIMVLIGKETDIINVQGA
jgi:trk system potassium uptake protein TrkA